MKNKLVLIFLILLIGCNKSKDINKNNFELFKSKVYKFELIDNSDVVPYFKNCMNLYKKMSKKGVFKRKRVEFLSENFLKITENFSDSRYSDDSLFYAGKLYYDLMDYDKALEYFDKLIQKYPEGSFSKLSNKYEYQFHVAPLAHFLKAKIYHFLKKQPYKAVWEYRQLIRNYAKYMDEKYVIDGNVGHIFAESRFYMAEIYKSLYNYKTAIKYYGRTVLRYGDLKWQNMQGDHMAFEQISIKKMYEIGLNYPTKRRLVIFNFSEMSNPKKTIYENSRMLIEYYLAKLYLKQKKYKYAIETLKNIFERDLKINYSRDVKIVLDTIDLLKKLDENESRYLKRLMKNVKSIDSICSSLIRGKSNDLLNAELHYYLAENSFNKNKIKPALNHTRVIFRKYPYLVSINNSSMIKKVTKLAKNNLPEKKYIKFIKKNVFFLSNKFSYKEVLMKEIEKYEAKKNNKKS